MYKAIHLQTGEEIIILNPYWRQRIDELRVLDRAGCLVCQGCQQPMRVKAGGRKRPHFAHKHLQACSYGSESPEILNARAVLYEWLLVQFGQGVTVEKQISGLDLPRPVDCWVETAAGSLAYWIIEAGIRIDPRTAIKNAFASLGVTVHWVFLNHMLNERKAQFAPVLQDLLLTPTERAFLQSTLFDEALAGIGEVGGSLHYLDADQSTLTTYRNLLLFHKPNWYRGIQRLASLASVQASPQAGEFFYPGETEQINAYKHKQQRLEEKRRRYQDREEAWLHRLEERKNRLSGDQWGVQSRAGETEMQAVEALPCATCGQITTDYWSTFFAPSGRKLCRCRECLERGI